MTKLSSKHDAGSNAHRQVAPIDMNEVRRPSIFRHIRILQSPKKSNLRLSTAIEYRPRHHLAACLIAIESTKSVQHHHTTIGFRHSITKPLPDSHPVRFSHLNRDNFLNFQKISAIKIIREINFLAKK
ncbi:hypothetical protein [Burkholderia singularis]|uniref:hypothetical protein n=1 Tax=Burkholderia singularis TaxID=1503053 RepID=UPI0011814D0A|nr:hypothetical protein [Burkholderia singularis]